MENKEKQVWEEAELTVVQFNDSDVIAASGCDIDGCDEDECATDCFGLGCFAAGTKITMADGSVRNIEDVREGDRILTFDHETGKLTAQEVCIAFAGDCSDHAFSLHFEDGTEVSVVGIHDLFEQESMKYVRISDDHAEEFVGKHFYSIAKKAFVKLSCVTRSVEKTPFYSLYTKYNFNAIANGMLSLPDDVDMHLNLYEFGEDLKINAEVLAADLARYGEYEYSEKTPCSQEEYDEWKLRYLNIIIGKGLATYEDMVATRTGYLQWRLAQACRLVG